MIRIRSAAIAFLAFCSCGVAAVAANEPDPAVAYMTSIAAPAMKSTCEKINPGHAAKFDALYPAWHKRQGKAIAAGRNAMRKPGQTDAQLDASVREMVQKFFNEDTVESRKAGCNEMLADLGR